MVATKFTDSTQLMVADTPPRVGRNRINDPDEKVTARFASGTLARIKAALSDKEPQSEFIRQAVERELARREKK
ncbi:hypothetical protein [Sphingobium fuliginis]|uniref:CopG family transcriptional regulator n=1 Tax=Sphingobium fuliginis ATCC 27551 TaxID=1208342 RepID=A0A5B8CGH7_SPHSA|nr:hypothetical protein [Sphingobium fuliginis]QDC37090.1 hypothetical protein FIL70_07510 [Sphingobium fuliginis ATCC 27551]